MATWKIINTTQANKGSSGDNQIVSVDFKVGHTIGGLTGWAGFKVDLPNTEGSFTAIDDVTESQVIKWVKAALPSNYEYLSVTECETRAKEEYNRIKAEVDKENLTSSQNTKSWE
tara:strand:- start:153 stop:497 length:345 start_codon:yes stop_codon:yes gene_type:complete